MQPHILPTHIEILKRAAINNGWSEFSFSEFNVDENEALACCQQLEDWGMIDFIGGGTEIGTSKEPPRFTPETSIPQMAITPIGIRELETHRE